MSEQFFFWPRSSSSSMFPYSECASSPCVSLPSSQFNLHRCYNFCIHLALFLVEFHRSFAQCWHQNSTLINISLMIYEVVCVEQWTVGSHWEDCVKTTSLRHSNIKNCKNFGLSWESSIDMLGLFSFTTEILSDSSKWLHVQHARSFFFVLCVDVLVFFLLLLLLMLWLLALQKWR